MTEEEVRSIVKQTLDSYSELRHCPYSSYPVDPKDHYAQHIWLTELMKWSSGIRNSFLRAFVTTLVAAGIGLLILGFLAWGRSVLK